MRAIRVCSSSNNSSSEDRTAGTLMTVLRLSVLGAQVCFVSFVFVHVLCIFVYCHNVLLTPWFVGVFCIVGIG